MRNLVFLLFLLIVNPKLNAITITNWGECAGIYSPMNEIGVATLSNKMYSIGGNISLMQTNVYVFDGTNWTEILGLPVATRQVPAITFSNTIYIVGGDIGYGTGTTNVFTFNGTTWSYTVGLPKASLSHSVAILNDKLYAFNVGVDSVQTNAYSFNGSIWSVAPKCPLNGFDTVATTLGNYIYSIGGFVGGHHATNTVYKFDGNTWTTNTPLPIKVAGATAINWNNNIYVSGGGGGDEGGAGTNVYVFDGTNWTEILGLPVSLERITFGTLGNNLYVIGGLRTNVYMFPIITTSASKPINPIPTNTAINQLISINLSWQNGGNADGYIINFGISNVMTNCGSTTTTNYNPGGLVYGTNYQWRIDATNILGITTGDVWAFSTTGDHDWYVATNGIGQGASWDDATNNLQGAITACQSNYTVWVSNGTYSPANLTIGGGITVRSKTGLYADVILDGNATARVVLMESNSWLIGCTVSNGHMSSGLGSGTGIRNGSVSNCLIINNAGDDSGAGVYNSTLYNCMILENNAGIVAGGVEQSSCYNCTISGNTSTEAAGAYASYLYNCVVSNNIALDGGFGGGGVENCEVYNSLIISNLCGTVGGGGQASTFYNCTIVGNTASENGGGGANCTFYNSISWNNNKIDSFYEGGSVSYSCGNGGAYEVETCITNNPLFVSANNFRLQNNSPCKDTGNNGAYASLSNSVDLDGTNRIINVIVDMGAYENTYIPPPPLKTPNMNGVEINKFLGGNVLRMFK
jgi:hypothetical protein